MTTDNPLFNEAEFYNGDPTDPGTDTPTPPEVVASLSTAQREMRVTRLVAQAHAIYDDGVARHAEGHSIVGVVALFSGGNDSTVLTHIFRDVATHTGHANTTIGIEQTRQFVRDTSALWGLPLIEKVAPVTYRDLVLERGFPGPAMHFKMFQRLKERALRMMRAELVKDGRSERVVFIAGRRRSESDRRQNVPIDERVGSVIWVSPLAFWTKLDLETYRSMHPSIPRNDVSDVLHMSGECLCGAFARPGELDEIGYWFPEVRDEIVALEADVRAAGHPEPFCRWGHGEGKPSSEVGQLCSSCSVAQVPGQSAMDFHQTP